MFSTNITLSNYYFFSWNLKNSFWSYRSRIWINSRLYYWIRWLLFCFILFRGVFPPVYFFCYVCSLFFRILIYSMGQVSLPRLEKINVSMSWESSVFYEKESWASPKLFLFHSLISKYFFIKRFRTINRVWKLWLIRRSSTFFSLNFEKKTLKTLKWSLKTHKDFYIFGRYLYQSGGKYSTIVVYTTRDSNQTIYTALLSKTQEITSHCGTK